MYLINQTKQSDKSLGGKGMHTLLYRMTIAIYKTGVRNFEVGKF